MGNEGIAEVAAATQPVPAPTVPLPILSIEPAAEGPSATASPVVEALASSAPSSSKKAKKAGSGQPNKKAECTPPYTVDENHIRRIKPQCL
jgi:hypothetical protein